MNGMIFDIEHGSFVDGPGIRTTVFFKGCNLKCAWCHNPESQSAKPQLLFYRDKCTGCGKCAKICPNALQSCSLCGECEIYCPAGARKLSGRISDAEEVLEEIFADRDFYGADGGVTFSGGECMLQHDFLLYLLMKCRERKIHTAVDTAGHIPFELFEKIMPYTDIFLYDLKVMDSEIHKKYVGVDNQRILYNLASLLSAKKRVWVRIPIIPDVNDSVENIKKVAEFYAKYGHPEKTELLPYHSMGENKYRALGLSPAVFATPEKEKIDKLQSLLNVF